jgi:hypothetical protein
MKKLTSFSFDVSKNPIDLDYLSVFMEQLSRAEIQVLNIAMRGVTSYLFILDEFKR